MYCLKLSHPAFLCVVDSLLHYAPDFIFNWIEAGNLLGDQKSDEMNARVLCSRRLIVSRARALGRCLAERWRTHQRPDVWQAATVVTVGHLDNRLHWPWLRDWWISNWCSLILTRRPTPSLHQWLTEFERFLNSYISQGSVATHLRCGGIFNYHFISNFLLRLTVQECWKSVNVWRSYGQESSV